MKARIGLIRGTAKMSGRAVSWFTRSPYNHIVVGFGGWCVSGQLGGAKLRRPGTFEDVLWLDIPLDDEAHAAVIDHALSLVGAPYNLAAVVLDGLHRLGVPVPYAAVDAVMGRRRHRTCAELVNECFQIVGVDLFPMPGFPYPAALLDGACQVGGARLGVGMAGCDSEIQIPNPDSRSEIQASETAGAAARACRSLGGARRWPRSRPGHQWRARVVACLREGWVPSFL